MLLAQGRTNPEIAETLVLSPYTVQDHIKSLFEKTSVSSRQELVARVFLDDYMPQVARGSALTSNGTFATETGATGLGSVADDDSRSARSRSPAGWAAAARR